MLRNAHKDLLKGHYTVTTSDEIEAILSARNAMLENFDFQIKLGPTVSLQRQRKM